MELHERLAPTARADLAIGDDTVAGERSTVGHSAGQLALIELRADPRNDPRAPARLTLVVVPTVDGRAGQTDPPEGDVVEGEAKMSGSHDPHGTSPTLDSSSSGGGRTIASR